MGAVYLALGTGGRLVAVQEMNVDLANPDEKAAFEQEARLLHQLDHPNIVRVIDFFPENNRQYMVMEYIRGRTLLNILVENSGHLPENYVLDWAVQLCGALDYLHRQQPKIIYRDLKPGNVMQIYGANQLKLIDFGIARLHKPGQRRDTIVFGTPGYAPPEQYGRGQTDERSDVYALGATLHHLLTGHDPSIGMPFAFELVCRLKPQLSNRIEAVIAKAVAPQPAQRFASIMEMRTALSGN